MSAVTPLPVPRRPDALACIAAVESVLSERASKRLRRCNEAWRKGHPPHPIVADSLKRAEYLRDTFRVAHAALAELAYVVAQEVANGHPRYAEQLRDALRRVQQLESIE